MQWALNLRRRPRMQLLVGALLVLIGCLMVFGSGPGAGDVVFGVLFLLGGLAWIGYFDRVVLDLAHGELIHRRGLFLTLRSRRYPLQKIRAIGLLIKTSGQGDNRKARFVVRLVGVRDSVLSSHADPWFSRLLAERLARRLRVPLRNRVYGRSSHREAADLDLPLVSRWARDGERFACPRLPGDTAFRERRDATGYSLSMPAQFPKIGYLSFVLLGLALALLAAAALGARDAATALLGIGLFALLGGVMSLAFAGRSRLSIGSGHVSFRQGLFPVRSRIAITAIEELVVAADGITLIGDAEAVWIHWAGNRSDSAYLEAVVPYELARLGRPHQAAGRMTL